MLDSNGDDITLGISGTMQRHNAALAVQLCKVWTDSRQKDQSQQEAPSEDDNNHQFILNHTEVKTLPTAVTEGLFASSLAEDGVLLSIFPLNESFSNLSKSDKKSYTYL